MLFKADPSNDGITCDVGVSGHIKITLNLHFPCRRFHDDSSSTTIIQKDLVATLGENTNLTLSKVLRTRSFVERAYDSSV
ncbi:hypothetical protein GMO_11430 [Gluconobacter morbifer G707]|uniref:Uncharacterized protein n=1 Tax=Gluconobacter morbifer G707 TaxID=1088869 RepID=G6XIR5_9PROT|nr:hypothetical protein GMO_11430 [Gluconobacter morbifer G707]